MVTLFIRRDGSHFTRDVNLAGAEISRDGCGVETEWIHLKPIDAWFRFDQKKSWEQDTPTFVEEKYRQPIILTGNGHCPNCHVDESEREGDEPCICED